MVGHVLVELGSDCSFQDFAEERKVGGPKLTFSG